MARLTRPLECQLLRDAPAIDAIAADWDRLWRAQPIRHVFQGHAWHRAILDAHGAERAPCVVAAYGETGLVGLLPLCVEGGELRFLGAPYSDYNDLLADPARSGDVLRAMVDALDAAGLPRARLASVRADACLRRAASDVDSRVGRRLRWKFAAACPTTLLEPDAAAAILPILRKKSLRRQENRLLHLGTLAFRHVEDPDEARTLLPEFFAQHTARRSMAGEGVLFDRPAPRRFYESLVSRLGLQTIRFGVLELNGAPVAFHFGFEYDRRFVFYKPAFTVELWDYSPGDVLLKKLFEYARDHELVEFDFTRGDEAFKARFANASRSNYTLHLLPPGAAGALAALRLRSVESLNRREAVRAAVERHQARATGLALAVRRHGALRLGRRAGVAAWRRFVHAREEVLVFRADRDRTARVPAAGLEIRRGRLRDLARTAPAYPELFHARRLQLANDRLGCGDQLFLALSEGRLLLVAWLGLRREIAPAVLGEDPRLPLEREGTVVYDYWIPAAASRLEAHPAVLGAIVEASAVPDVWTFCGTRDTRAARAIAAAGFAESHRMGRIRWLGRTRRTWVETVSGAEPPLILSPGAARKLL